jgi:hypothetical protein
MVGHVINSPSILKQGKRVCDFTQVRSYARRRATRLDCEFIYTYEGSTWGPCSAMAGCSRVGRIGQKSSTCCPPSYVQGPRLSGRAHRKASPKPLPQFALVRATRHTSVVCRRTFVRCCSVRCSSPGTSTYVNFEIYMPRRIYTDARDFPTDEEPSFIGYSIGKWLDTDGDGRYDTLEVETRNFKGPRTVEATGMPLHDDNETVVAESIYLDKANNNLMHNEITIVDHDITRPWTVDKHYLRERKVLWIEDSCNENNHHVVIGTQNYFLSGDGYLMPARKDQPPPDLRYFKQTGK